MTDKFIHYEYEGKNLKVPVEQQKEFESKVPSAKMMLTYNDKNYKVPISEVGSFAEKVGADKLTYSAFDDKKEYVPSLSTERYLSFEEPEAFEPAPAIEEVETPSIAASIETPDMTRKEKRQARREEKANDGKVTWGETIKNKTGAMLSGLGKYALDALILSTSGQGMNPRTGEMYEMVDLEERLQNPDVVTKARMDLAKKQEELSKAGEASEEGFFDLAIKGKVGKALQKGLGSTIESLPMTVLASNPYLSTLYGIAMAGSNYVDETIENPDIPEWKRRINATGTAALEYAVEKLADPIAKYIGGKNGAELTEEAAKDLLDRIAKEGSEGIAKRIFNYLKKVGKNTAKDAVGEGLEEVATSLGTDALGSALDAIDGNADYGFSAQWEKMKEENPDASLADFALSKGKEYMDSFIGGALSGTYMAGGAQLVSDGVNLAYEKKADRTIQNLRNSGASKGPQDFYDVDGDVKSAADEVVSAFTKDGESAVSREFIDGLSAEQASALAQKADLPMEQRNALQKYAYTKAVQEGLNGKYDDILQENINIQNILIDNVQDNGVVVAGFYNEQPVYIKGGVANDGAVTLPSGENGPVVVINALTGEQQTVRSEDIKYAESTNADEYRTSVETQMRDNDARNRDVWRNTMSVKAKRNDVAQYVGSKILVNLGNGLAEVEVQKMLENGIVLIKGKKGDLGGQSEVMMPAELFYDAISRNEDGSPTLVETPEIEEAPEVEAEVEQPTQVVPQGDEDFRGMTTSILINGKPVDVEVTYQDNTSDTITYQYTDENGRTRTGSSTIGAFMTAMQGASEYNPEVVAPEPEVVPETEISGETTPEAPTTEVTPIVEQEPVVEEETDWDTLFATDPKAYLEELQRQFGDGAIDIIKGEIQAAQDELDALEKKRGATMNERMANLKKKADLNLRIGSLNELLEYLERKGMAAPAPAPEADTPTAPETTTPTEPETPAEAEPIEETEPEGETPAGEDTGETVLDNGYIVKDGKIVNPDVIEMPNSPKEANRIFIAEKDGKWGFGWYALMDNNSASWNDTIQLENLRYNSEKEAIEAALKYFEFYRNHGQNKNAESTAMDAFVQYVKDTYFGNEPTNTPEPDGGETAPEVPTTPETPNKPKVKIPKFNVKDILLKGTGPTKGHAYSGVHYEDGYAVATNGFVIVAKKESYPSENEGKVITPKGEVIGTKFPKWKMLLKDFTGNDISFDIQDMYEFVMSLKDKYGKEWGDVTVEIEGKDGKSHFFYAKYLLPFLKAANEFGGDFSTRGGAGLALMISSDKGTALIQSKPTANFNNEKYNAPAPQPVAPIAPIAPTAVDNPIEVAKVKDENLLKQIQRTDLPNEQKQDLAWSIGKQVADLFATREEYDAYAETAPDFGKYNSDYERGVDESFANRQQNAGDSQGNNVPLGNEPKGESNGEGPSTESGDGQSPRDNSGQPSDKGTEAGDKGTAKKGKGKAGKGKVEDKYPARKGNATRKLLIDTFGFAAVTIPDSRKNTLNSIYDFMMEMSKMLGISPKSIGQGGWLSVANLRANNYAAAEHVLETKVIDQSVVSATLKYKYAKLRGIAHEWWHSLDHALQYFAEGKGKQVASDIPAKRFSGRSEVYQAIQDILKAIKDSGHENRMLGLNAPIRYKHYLVENSELLARAFDEYINNKFAAAGIKIEGTEHFNDAIQPTPEEMAVIAPYFVKLFEILQEKEGKTTGTSVLYHIAKGMDAISEVKNELGELVAKWAKQGGNIVIVDTAEMNKALAEEGVDTLKTADGVVYGFVKDGAMYLNPSLLNPDTSIHEYTHLWDNALMQLNPALWEKGKKLMKQTSLWNEVINDPNYADIKDNEDLVASEVHSRLVGEKGAERLNQLEQDARANGLTKGAKELSILGRLREWLNEATKWLKDAFSSWTSEEVEAVSLDDFLNMPLRDLANFTKLPTDGTISNANGEVVARNNGNGQIQFSISTWAEGGRDYLAEWLRNDNTLEEDEKADILARMDEFYENAKKYTDTYVPFGTWSDAAVKYDDNGNPLMSVIKANGDYAMNLDFSLVCKKRRPLNRLLRTLINRNAFGTYSLREREIAEINWILQEHGFEVACALCFVDSKRYRVTNVADVFAALYNKMVKTLAPKGAPIAHFNYSNNPNVEVVENGIDTMPDEQLNWKEFDRLANKFGPKTVEGKVAAFLRANPSQRRLVDATDFIESEGFEAVKANNPSLLSLYNSKKGTSGPKASFGDVQYLNDILKREKMFDVEKAYAVGGVRLQSFSDFVPHMYFDYMQLFAELAAKKLPAHAYTKEMLFAKIFGLTGIKINMSLVPAVVEGGVASGLDANGNYTWADAVKDADGNIIQQAQSFDYDEAVAIQNAEGYSKNCGIIAVGISDEHIRKMLDDPNIPFIIPYHKSSLNAIVARMTNIDKYKDYTKVQNTRKADGSKLEAGTKHFSFKEYLHSLGENGTPQQAAQAYLDWCKENNYIPKFNEFAGHPNYYKLLVDFNTIDVKTGEYTPQSAVTMTFPTQENAFGDVESLIQQGLAEDAASEEKMDEEMEQVADEVEAMLKRTASEPKLSEKKQLAKMAQLADERKAKIDAIAAKGDTEFVENSLTLQDNENIEEHTSDSERLNNSGRLYQSTGQGISWDDLANFNPIYEREGESVRQRNLREAKFFSSLNNLTVDERISFYAFLKEYFQNPSGALKARVNEYIKSLRDGGNNELADFAEQFINDELRYREGVSAQAVMRHGLISGATYSISVIEHIFNAFNNDKYNGVLFDRVMNLAKRFGVTVSFRTRGDNGDYFDVLGQYDLHSNTISLDANLLAKGNEEELCRTILHELIHSVIARSNAIMGGNVLDKNNKLIDPTTLPNDVIDGINTLREVYDAIKDDDAFKNEYGAKDLDEMVSEVSNPKFRTLLKAKNLWKKFLNGICRILGIKEIGSAQTDALTEIESALDKILSSAERGELDSIYANYLGKLPSGLPLSELQKLEDSAAKSMLMADKLFRTGIDPTDVATATAAQTYDRVVSDNWQEFQRQFQDAFQPVRIAIDAIQQETGNIPIEDYENYLLVQNLSSSRSRVEIDDFARRYYSPIIEQVNALIDEVMEMRRLDKTDKKMRAEVYKEVIQYLISKHGLERNKYYQANKKRKLTPYEQQKEIEQAENDLKDAIDAILAMTNLSNDDKAGAIDGARKHTEAKIQEIKTREVPDLRDYSGLTSLYGMKPKKFKEAEAEAQKTVDDFEKSLGRVDDPATGMVYQAEAIEKLWERINAATNKTLRHSYESGLLSRQQYEDIKGMFNFYIPLRGFDETTAEDVYAYARFEGNGFNPAVQTAKGRTSVADDPIAIIMNMAESEIAQGNKNRAKQALYNFLLNRAKENNEQNTLMQLEDVWYVKTIDSSGNEVLQIAAPDHEHGETYDEFEERMKTLAEIDMAMKSKKGKVDVGMRFQKQMDRSAHYVYLKVNGVEKAIYINGNPKAADAINGKYVPKMTKTMEIVKGVQRVVSSTFTNYSLEFTLRNFFRDMVYSHINIDVRESDPEYRKKFRQNWRHNNVVSVMKLLKAYRAGELDGVALNEDQAAFVEFMKNGGQTGYTLINSVEAHKKDLQRAIARMQNGVVRGGIKDSAVFKYTLGGIELLNEVSELVTRFAAYKTSRDMGRGINKAVNDAKEITVNFNTKGAQDGTGWMGAIARYLGAVKYFFNASVQGVQNLYAMLQKNPIKFGTTVGSIVALGALMPVLQGILWSLVTGDDEDEYWNIPEYDRQNNLCFVVGKGKYVKVPLPIGFREMYGIGDMIAGGVMNKKFVRDPMAVGMDVANKLATIILPINPLEGSANGLSIIESAQDVFLPDFTQGMLQNRTNKDWKSAPIQKEYTYNEHDPQWTKAFKSNPAWLTGLSKWCYEHINIDGKPLDFSPEKMDNTLSNMFGGVYSLIKKAGRTVSMVWNEDSRNMSNIPLIGVIIGSGVDKDERFVNSTYWEMDEYYNDRIKLIETTAERFNITLDDVFKRVSDGEAPAGAHHPEMSKIYGKRNFDFMQEWYLAHKGEGIENEYGEKELGLSQLKTKVNGVENKIKKNENGEPTLEQIEELAMWNNRYEEARRDLVYDLLELD